MKRKSVLYLDVAEKIKKDILSGKYAVGQLLPTESDFEELFHVSKITIRKAIELLAAEELVEKKSGRGTTVLSNRPYNKLAKATTFTEFLRREGEEIEKENLSFEEIELSEEHPAFQYFGSKAVHFRRLYNLDHQPYVYFDYYLPAKMNHLTLADFESDSLYRLMTQEGLMIDRFDDSFAAVALDFEMQKFMITPEPNALKRTRKSITANGTVVEYSEAIYNTALHPYVVEYEA